MKSLLRVIHIKVHPGGFFVCVVTVVRSSFSSVITLLWFLFRPPPLICETISVTMFLMSSLFTIVYHKEGLSIGATGLLYIWRPFVRNNGKLLMTIPIVHLFAPVVCLRPFYSFSVFFPAYLIFPSCYFFLYLHKCQNE